MLRTLWWSWVGGRFLTSERPLYARLGNHAGGAPDTPASCEAGLSLSHTLSLSPAVTLPLAHALSQSLTLSLSQSLTGAPDRPAPWPATSEVTCRRPSCQEEKRSYRNEKGPRRPDHEQHSKLPSQKVTREETCRSQRPGQDKKLPSEYGTHKTVKARFWPGLSGQSS